MFSYSNIHSIKSVLEQYGCAVAWCDKERSSKYGVMCLFVVGEDYSFNDYKHYKLLFESSKRLHSPVEVFPISTKYNESELNDLSHVIPIIGRPLDAVFSPTEDWLKWYQSVNAIACAHIARTNDLLQESYQRLLLDIEKEQNGTTAGTYQLIKRFFDEFDEQLIFDWFSTDCPLMQQLRRTSPFNWIRYDARFEKQVLDAIADIVNDEEKRKAIPSYSEWLEHQLKKKVTSESFLKYIPRQFQQAFTIKPF